MKPQHYIALITDESADAATQKMWYTTVKELAPAGTVRTIPHADHQTAMIEFTINLPDGGTMQSLVVPLTRDLDSAEGEVIVTAMDMMGPDSDWEIEASNLYQDDGVPGFDFEFQADPGELEEMKEMVNKFVHSRWVEQKTTNGWRYGPLVDHTERTHPALRPWEQLQKEHRRTPDITEQDVVRFLKKYGYR